MGLQQHPHPWRRPMESRFYHTPGTFRTNSDVLWVLQCTIYIPGLHEPHLHWHDSWKVAKNLHGWHQYPHQRWPYPSPWMDSLCSSMTMRTWTFPQDLQMYLWCPTNGVPRDDNWSRESRDGPKETGHHQILETPHFHQSHTIFHRICQLLPQVHTKLLKHCHTPKSPHLKERALGLDKTTTKHLQHTQTNILLHSSSPNPRCHPFLHHYDRHLPPHCWSCTYAD